MTYIDNLQDSWNRLGAENAFWAVLSDQKAWDPKEFFQTGRKEIAHVLSVLKTYRIKVNLDVALDFGCGVGRLSQALGEHFRQVIGIDIAPSMIARAKDLNHSDNVNFRHVASGDLKAFADKSIDFVFTDIVFQHIRSDLTKNYLEEMYRIMKSGGVLVFQLPSQPALTWKGFLIRVLPNSILNYLRKGMEMHPIRRHILLNYLKELGYEIITVKPDPRHKHWHAYFYYVRKS